MSRPLGLIDEHLQEARGRYIIVLVDHSVRLAQPLGPHSVVLAQFGQHVLRRHVGSIVVGDPLIARYFTDGM
jgi:hypothetical protein